MRKILIAAMAVFFLLPILPSYGELDRYKSILPPNVGILKELSNSDPDNYDLLLVLARAQFFSANPTETDDAILRALALDSNRFDAYYMMQELSLGTSKIDQLIESNTNSKLLYYLYYLRSRSHGLPNSLSKRHSVVELLFPPAWGGLVSEAAKTSAQEQAILKQILEDCDKSIRLNPTFGEVYYWRGFIYENRDDLQKAQADHEKALALGFDEMAEKNARKQLRDAQLGEACRRIADYFKEHLNLEDAAAFYKEAEAFDPGNKEFYDSLLNELAEASKSQKYKSSKRKQLEGTAQYYTALIKRDPRNVDNYLKRAVANWGMGKYQESINDLYRIETIVPGGTRGFFDKFDKQYFSLRNINLEEQNPGKRTQDELRSYLASIDGEIAKNPENPQSWQLNERNHFLFDAGNPQPLLDQYKNADDLGKYYALYLSLNRYDEVIAETSKTLSGYDNVFSYFYRGYAFAKKGEYQKAINDYTAIITLKDKSSEGSYHPDEYPGALYNRAVVYYYTGQYKLAMEDIGRLTKDSDFSHLTNPEFFNLVYKKACPGNR